MDVKKTVLLVGDVVADRAKAIATRSYDADKPTTDDVAQISGWLVEAGYGVDVMNSVTDFVANPPGARDIVVLPLWRGGASRNRTAIVPAICEELRIAYVGGDVFVQTVCQDKSLSKVFVRDAGFHVPREWYIPACSDITHFEPSQRLKPPFVVKPQYSGASIGIDDRSLCITDEEAKARANELFSRDLGPVLCEEFIRGDEISLCFIEERGSLVTKCVVTFLDGARIYPYRDRLMTFDEKAREDDGCSLTLWPHSLPNELWEKAAKLVRLLGKVDHMRIDGRIDRAKFTVIELTQDFNLGLTSELVGGFNAAGLNPPRFLDLLIQSSLRSQAS